MVDSSIALLVVGYEYRISRLLTQDRRVRNILISFGLVPGEVIKIINCLFGGRYWVIRVHEQLIGLRKSELQLLQLHVSKQH